MPALQKTLTFVLLILAGYLLQRKITGKQELRGVKVMILSVILPATIFVALLRVEIAPSMLLLPVLALALNGALYGVSRWAVPRLGYAAGSPQERTMLLLVPSLAPGLSCFPFILEYLGEESLALAALADVGNKVFVLIILYMVAMHWFYASRQGADETSRTTKLKELGGSLLREPVNLVILLAIGMLSFGLTVGSLPAFLENTVGRLASLMTPVVLLFIGMAVRFRKQEMALILRTLCYRSGLGMILSAGLIYWGGLGGSMALLAVIFAQCAVSFWPFAHMAAAEAQREEGSARVFDLDLGLNVLAFSLPFSTVIILVVLSFGDWFSSPLVLLPAAAVLWVGPIVYLVRGWLPAEGGVEKAGV